MKPLFIFEIDEVLANTSKRSTLLQEDGDWSAFYRAVSQDKPIRSAGRLFLHLWNEGKGEVQIWTGRSEEARERTAAWLHKSFGWEDVRMKMRPADSRAPVEKLKKQWLTELSDADRSRLTAVVEARTSCVSMWRTHGVLCLQSRNLDF